MQTNPNDPTGQILPIAQNLVSLTQSLVSLVAPPADNGTGSGTGSGGSVSGVPLNIAAHLQNANDALSAMAQAINASPFVIGDVVNLMQPLVDAVTGLASAIATPSNP